jgi:hypothetical protein
MCVSYDRLFRQEINENPDCTLMAANKSNESLCSLLAGTFIRVKNMVTYLGIHLIGRV